MARSWAWLVAVFLGGGERSSSCTVTVTVTVTDDNGHTTAFGYLAAEGSRADHRVIREARHAVALRRNESIAGVLARQIARQDRARDEPWCVAWVQIMQDEWIGCSVPLGMSSPLARRTAVTCTALV